MKKSTWNTFAVRGFTFDAANDRRSAGGLHCHEVRQTPTGWQTRIRQCNGNWQAYGPVRTVDDAQGEACFATAQQR